MIVKIPEDIKAYENKAMGNFTMRQIICLGIVIVIVAPIFWVLFHFTNSIDISAIVACILGVPVMLCGFVKRDGIYLEKIIIEKYKEKKKYKVNRPFVMHNMYEDIQTAYREELQREQEEKDREERLLQEQEDQKNKYKKRRHKNTSVGKKKHRTR